MGADVLATHCPVCGYGPYDEPDPSYHALALSYDICPCCFAEYGYDDTLRFDDWIEQGMPWRNESLKPACWDAAKQIENAIEGWVGCPWTFFPSPKIHEKYSTRIDDILRQVTDANPKKRLSAVMILGCSCDDRADAALEIASRDSDEDVCFFCSQGNRPQKRIQESTSAVINMTSLHYGVR